VERIASGVAGRRRRAHTLRSDLGGDRERRARLASIKLPKAHVTVEKMPRAERQRRRSRGRQAVRGSDAADRARRALQCLPGCL
jgi:hypothetical protein